MRILKFKDKLIEETSYASGKVVFFRYLKDDDKDKCECGRTIDREMSIVEGCRNWDTDIKPVSTLETSPS